MADDGKQPIIIKKIKKGGHGHHGGAWKIAYADFVTAMMAFFLLLWLLNSVTQESLEGISNYFAPVSASPSTSGSGDILGGKTISEPGASQSASARESVTVDLPPPKAGSGGDLADGSQAQNDDTDPSGANEDAVEALQAQQEQEQFEDAKQQLEEALNGIPNMRQLRDSLLVDNTPEGLRIQLIDRDGLAMFPSGGTDMYLHAQRVIEVVSKVINALPQDVSVKGHTDATPFNRTDYSNWELSADRANAARRQLIRFGVAEDRIANVVGKAARDPLLTDDPRHPSNRRLSITLLRGTGEQAAAELDKAAQQVEEALPGLTEIQKRQQLGLGAPSGGPSPTPAPSPAQPGTTPATPGLNLEIQQTIQ